ncbi:MAG: aldehyde dehydrogenase [Lachnospiraceae bacterium]|nr:aldehyde dehydrogenase [Lachnospiraceae bacterium]
MDIENLVEKQRIYFATGRTHRVDVRIRALERLELSILDHEKELSEALKSDLGKSRSESYMCEIGLTLSELRYLKRHLKLWAMDKVVPTPLSQFPGMSFVTKEPYGVTLIMSPWNYPVLLTLEPLAGAIAAGNCCVVKPSAYSPATSAVMAKIIDDVFLPEYVAVVEGGRKENSQLLDQKFDYIFFTGSVAVGKLVMEKASANLTPVTLELGGKSPVIIDSTAKIPLAARRIVFGKYLNLGQTCVAPDYVLVCEDVKEQFLACLKKEIRRQFGERPLENPDYGKMINEKHFHRVCGLIRPEKIICGGEADLATLKIAPTVLSDVTADDAVMQEEIFGPVLPVISVKSVDEAISFVNARPRPLALYIFTEDKRTERKVLESTSYGGGCINDVVIHLATSYMGFGGVGNSGMGSYHGKKSFETFTHEKSIMKKYTFMDMPLRYQPYSKIKDLMVRTFVR